MANKVIIDKDLFIKQVLDGMTIPELQKFWNCSRTTITGFKKKHDLVGISPNSRKTNRVLGLKICSACRLEKPLESFYSNGYSNTGVPKYKSKCISCTNTSRRDLKKSLIMEYLASLNKSYNCEDCGDTDVYGFLEFHHLHSKEFDIGFATVSSTKQFESTIIPELNKCVLLCPNCHRRRHLLTRHL